MQNDGQRESGETSQPGIGGGGGDGGGEGGEERRQRGPWWRGQNITGPQAASSKDKESRPWRNERVPRKFELHKGLKGAWITWTAACAKSTFLSEPCVSSQAPMSARGPNNPVFHWTEVTTSISEHTSAMSHQNLWFHSRCLSRGMCIFSQWFCDFSKQPCVNCILSLEAYPRQSDPVSFPILSVPWSALSEHVDNRGGKLFFF